MGGLKNFGIIYIIKIWVGCKNLINVKFFIIMGGFSTNIYNMGGLQIFAENKFYAIILMYDVHPHIFE